MSRSRLVGSVSSSSIFHQPSITPYGSIGSSSSGPISQSMQPHIEPSTNSASNSSGCCDLGSSSSFSTCTIL